MLYCIGGKFAELGVAERKLVHHGLEGALMRDYVFLRTCERAELYSTTNGVGSLPVMGGRDALAHLFRVACGIDSRIIGENEILAQVRNSYESALVENHCSDELSSYLCAALRLGRKARAETGIAKGKTSIISIVVENVALDSKILVVGSGMLAGKLAKAIRNKSGEPLIIANRHFERAQELAGKIGCGTARLSELQMLLKDANVVICATSAPYPLITPETLPTEREVTLIDLGAPHNVAKSAGRMKNIKLLTLENFQDIARRNSDAKREEVKKVEEMIEHELRRLELKGAI